MRRFCPWVTRPVLCGPALAGLLAPLGVAVAFLGGAAVRAEASSAAAERSHARWLSPTPANLARLGKRTPMATGKGPRRRRSESPSAPQATTFRTTKALAGRTRNTLPERVGFSGSVVWYENAEQLAWLRRLRGTGAGWIREDFHWGAFEPRPGVWTWSVGDRLMRNAAIVGVDVLGAVSYSARWAASGPTIYHPPRNPAHYAEFCRRLVERYGPGGSFWQANRDLEPRPLRALEIWNEPWNHFFWRPNPDPAAYVRLVRAAATAIRQADQDVEVLASADIFQMRAGTTESRDWFRLLLEIDAGVFRRLVDAYSVHAYSQRRGPKDTSVAQRWRYDRVLLTRDLAARSAAAHPIWITEFGWTTAASHPDGVSETRQALYLRRALERAVGEWDSFVERAFIYHWGRVESDNIGGFGFFRADGDAKPAVRTLRSLLRAPGRLSR
jgi:polysaccharide biosynthesis protein PslG